MALSFIAQPEDASSMTMGSSCDFALGTVFAQAMRTSATAQQTAVDELKARVRQPSTADLSLQGRGRAARESYDSRTSTDMTHAGC